MVERREPGYLAESRSSTVKSVMWVVSLVPFVIVCLRLYVRIKVKGVFGWDDGIVMVAMGCLVAYAAVSTAAANIGLGKHLEVVEQNPNNLIYVALLCNIGETLAIMACTLGKTSFAVTLLRIIVQRWAQTVLWFVIITMNVVNVLAALFVFVQCKDPRHLWNPAIPSECWPTYVFTNFSLFVGAYSGAQDFVLALLPWTIIWRLQMQKKEKLGIAVAMSLGIFAGGAAIVKTTYLVALSAKSDFTWELAPLLIWAAVEDGLAIAAASIPALRPLLRIFFPSTQSDNSYHNKWSYPLKAVSNDADMFSNPQGESHATVYPASGDADDKSNTSILRDRENIWWSQTIKRTTEVDIRYNHTA
ncbi:hypothetical protein VTN00DRAFT_10069 [Thermoascus crustaceus]|uniref:uncharacterized protein n=1 Tax=Thermoascus crustaceus TaxID=5088 RepID=UPI0037420AF0